MVNHNSNHILYLDKVKDPSSKMKVYAVNHNSNHILYINYIHTRNHNNNHNTVNIFYKIIFYKRYMIENSEEVFLNLVNIYSQTHSIQECKQPIDLILNIYDIPCSINKVHKNISILCLQDRIYDTLNDIQTIYMNITKQEDLYNQISTLSNRYISIPVDINYNISLLEYTKRILLQCCLHNRYKHISRYIIDVIVYLIDKYRWNIDLQEFLIVSIKNYTDLFYRLYDKIFYKQQYKLQDLKRLYKSACSNSNYEAFKHILLSIVNVSCVYSNDDNVDIKDNYNKNNTTKSVIQKYTTYVKSLIQKDIPEYKQIIEYVDIYIKFKFLLDIVSYKTLYEVIYYEDLLPEIMILYKLYTNQKCNNYTCIDLEHDTKQLDTYFLNIQMYTKIKQNISKADNTHVLEFITVDEFVDDYFIVSLYEKTNMYLYYKNNIVNKCNKFSSLYFINGLLYDKTQLTIPVCFKIYEYIYDRNIVYEFNTRSIKKKFDNKDEKGRYLMTHITDVVNDLYSCVNYNRNIMYIVCDYLC